MKKTISILKVAVKNITSNKLRSALTMIGLIIGIVSVILLVGIGTGATSDVTSEVQSLGTGTLTISIDSSSDATLEYNQLENIKRIENIESVAPYKTVSGTVSKGTVTFRGANILATTPSYLEIMNLTISDGRLLSNIDLNNNSKICLIGTDLASTLFEEMESKDIIGEYIKIDGDNYTIVGVLTSAGSTMGNNIDSTLIIPFTTAKYLGSDTSISTAYVEVENENNISIEINKEKLELEKLTLYYPIPENTTIGSEIHLNANMIAQTDENEKVIYTSQIIVTVVEKEEEINKQEENKEQQNKDELINNENALQNQIEGNQIKAIGSVVSEKNEGYSTTPQTSETAIYNGKSNNYLADLTIENISLNTEFKKENTTYFVEVEDKSSLNINATAEDEDAVICITGEDSLQEGENKILISVTAENGNVRYYRIFVNNR